MVISYHYIVAKWLSVHGVRLLHANDGLEAIFQAKRAKRAMLPDDDMIWENGFDKVIRRRKKRRHN